MLSKKSINYAVLGSVIAVVVGGYFLMNYSTVGTPAGVDREFKITSFQWGFEPQFIEVNKGDHVVLKLTTDDVAHGIAIDEFQIREPILGNEQTQVEFVADRIGTFEFYCSVPCGAGHAEQHGLLIVKDPLESKPEDVTVTAIKSDEKIIIDGIIDDQWNKIPETIFTTFYGEEGRQVKVKSISDDQSLFLLLRWDDDDANNNSKTATDRIAIGFDISGNSDIAMGAAGVPHVNEAQRTIGEGIVDIWHWKAYDSHTESLNIIDDEFAGPFEQLKEHYYRDDDNKHGGQNDLKAYGTYNKETKEWVVEISRKLATLDVEVNGFGEIDKQFSHDESFKIAFAIWDGGKGETAGDHSVTDWGWIKIE